MKKIKLDWEIGPHTADSSPETFFPASVPGAVQLDYAAAHHWPPFWHGDNWREYRWMENSYWTYRTRFAAPNLADGETLVFVAASIDYQCRIYFNDEFLIEHTGMFSPVHIDLTDCLHAQNELRIVISPAPKLHRDRDDRTQADQSCKPAVSYGWDWHPRLIPLGLADEAYLQIRPRSFLNQVEFGYELNPDCTRADLDLQMDIGGTLAGTLRWQLKEDEKIVWRGESHVQADVVATVGRLDHPRLWWPHDQGAPYLYKLRVELFDETGNVIDCVERRLGFRRARLVMNEGAWEEPAAFPKSRSVPPAQLEINGRKMFCKGSNWVPPEIFPGVVDAERYRELLQLAKDANFNIVRVWGGGPINKTDFYDLCDAMGLLVWQDFPLACNAYTATPAYLKVLQQEARSIIEKIKPHPCLAIWCGGNELFNAWSGMTDQAPALRLLNSLCYQLDPYTPFIATSPLMGMGHGHYIFYDDETRQEVLQWMPRAQCTAYPEFGMPGPANVDTLKSFLPESELWPPRRNTAWHSHHAFDAWQGETWLMPRVIERYFGSSENLNDLVERGQFLQSVGYQFIFEQARRKKPYCAMALNWCFNEPWPTAANNSLLCWPAEPKPAFKAVKQACRPVLASARFARLMWKPGEVLELDLFLLNDAPDALDPVTVQININGDSEHTILEWTTPCLAPNRNGVGPTARFQLPAWSCHQFKIELNVVENPEWSSAYTLLFRPERKTAGPRGLNQ